ncbi:MAG: hypothetical protein KF802_00690 [Bdellovibrionaceae bacterium]|nr:hypothetical protein [Pseudobdellovibrionaceae bacterium]MBX3034992.1 hypothetical protein [Pseudobdellovibrionaceae bacterium]
MASDEGHERKSSKKEREDLAGMAAGLMGDALKKVFSVGVSAAFMTEENVRQYLQDMKLPKEVLGLVLQSANRSKDEITNRVSNEIIKIVSKIDWVKELARFAESHKFKISAEIDIIRKENLRSGKEG